MIRCSDILNWIGDDGIYVPEIFVEIGQRSVRKQRHLGDPRALRHSRSQRLSWEMPQRYSDAYKEFHEVDKDNNEVFKFGDNHMRVEDNEKCDITIEQIKEVGDMIGVSWIQVET
ncbi:hypothetical protein Tco_0925070 [Tanacetum coccineum]|uniref:Uncharacterized protein n=1 Tax=Tanacetum coccineum TaxID=301880 RepID=A0ABQ5D8S3_9ASTR